MMAEIIGREDGYCRGRGGSMHITAIEQGMLGADAIVAGSSALAVGAAHGLRLQGKDSVVVCFFGDGAANQGILHEACNLAAVLNAQVDLRLREQRVGDLDTRRRLDEGRRTSPIRAAGYGFPGVIVDGNDVDAVRAVTDEALARARAGDGPTLIEAKSYRITPHSAATKTDLRPEAELDALAGARSDPAALAEARRVGRRRVARIEEIEAQARADVDAAVEFALASPRPDPETVGEDVYAPADWNTLGQLS